MNKNKGITLIALIVTIVILLILAGISIATLGGENGLFARAKQAKNNTIDAQIQENIALSGYNNTIDEIVFGNGGIKEELEVNYIVSYKTEAGSGNIESITVKEGSTVKLSNNENGFVYQEYECVGWIDGKGNEYSLEQEIEITSDLELTAKWQAIEAGKLFLFSNGEQYADTTGGWTLGWTYGTHNYDFNNDNIYVYGYYPNIYNWNGCAVIMQNSVDLTNYNNLYIEYVSASGSDNGQYIRITDTKQTHYSVYGTDFKLKRSPNEHYTEQIDISGLTGNKYIGIAAAGCDNLTGEIYMYKLWLE